MLMEAMAREGMVKNIIETKMNQEEYIKYLADKFGSVLNITKKDQYYG